MQEQAAFEALYPAIQAWLSDGQSSMQADEAHGLLCGLLVGNDGDAESRWVSEVFGEAGAPPDDGSQQLLQRIFEQTKAQLNDQSFAFFLLLPDDDQSLGERAAALGRWCQGLLLGLSVTGVSQAALDTDDHGLPEEVTEVISDVSRIAEVEADGAEDSDEADFVEVAEYIRMATLLLAEHLRGPQPGTVVH
jgi:hypothetical protein